MAMADLVSFLGWTSCQVIRCEDQYCLGLAARFGQVASGKGVTVQAVHTWSMNDLEATKSLLRGIAANCGKSRVLVLCVHASDAKEIFAAANATGLSGKVIWLGSWSASSLDNVYLPEGYLGLRIGINQSNPKLQQLQAYWKATRPSSYPGDARFIENPRIAFAYDAVFALAHAYTELVRSNKDVRDGDL
eukprot:408328-Hanusia_phi.AAC.1